MLKSLYLSPEMMSRIALIERVFFYKNQGGFFYGNKTVIREASTTWEEW